MFVCKYTIWKPKTWTCLYAAVKRALDPVVRKWWWVPHTTVPHANFKSIFHPNQSQYSNTHLTNLTSPIII